MAWRVVWTEPAWSNLEAAADFIAQDSARYAAALVREARDAARSLSQFANRGRVVPEINDAGDTAFSTASASVKFKSSHLFILPVISGLRSMADVQLALTGDHSGRPDHGAQALSSAQPVGSSRPRPLGGAKRSGHHRDCPCFRVSFLLHCRK